MEHMNRINDLTRSNVDKIGQLFQKFVLTLWSRRTGGRTLGILTRLKVMSKGLVCSIFCLPSFQ